MITLGTLLIFWGEWEVSTMTHDYEAWFVVEGVGLILIIAAVLKLIWIGVLSV